MRRWATSERTMTRRTHQPARRIRLASSACISRARAVSATPTSSDEAGTTIVPRASSKCKLDYEPQLEGRMTLQAAAHSACNSARHLSRNLRFLAVFHRVLEKDRCSLHCRILELASVCLLRPGWSWDLCSDGACPAANGLGGLNQRDGATEGKSRREDARGRLSHRLAVGEHLLALNSAVGSSTAQPFDPCLAMHRSSRDQSWPLRSWEIV
jgi:hypothetical protein